MSTPARKWTCLLMEAMDSGLFSPKDVAEMCLVYMSEADVEDMCRVNDLKDLDPEKEEEQDPEDALDDFNYVGSRHHY